MMKINSLALFFGLSLLFSCQNKKSQSSLQDLIQEFEGKSGKQEYLASPYVTAGDRVYMVGHQDGTFPDLGFHVEGEMGGIWNHPIKLMDGFTVAIGLEGNSYCLDKADEFVNYPVANKHIFREQVPGLEVERFQFIPDRTEGLILEFSLKNVDNSAKTFGFEFAGHTDLMPVWLGERAGMVDHEDILDFDEERQA
ncbi:hypothetical protein [Indibacter alkaliphilus]|uniref:hypothetical protein n=1 Tax=Indibacter alkaliphilus TaxID=579922 RepID=UPI001F3E9581|nr:hypothetical protein [Indibacter alkaliphilus]